VGYGVWDIICEFNEKEVQRALRKTLLKYKLHKEQDLFDKAYDYIREHY